MNCAQCNTPVNDGEGFLLNPRLVKTEHEFETFPKGLWETIIHAHKNILFCDKCMEVES